MRIALVVGPLVLAGTAARAHAQAPDELNRCRAIPDGPTRLACFDKLFHVAEPESEQPGKSGWRLTDGLPDLDRSRKVEIQLEAEKASAGKAITKTRAGLVIACQERQTR